MSDETTYTKISDKDFIKKLENAIKDLNKWNDELYKENRQLKEEVGELKLMVGLRQKRDLISKFDKEYDEEDKKKNPNREYAGIVPDAEEIYKRYYEQKDEKGNLIKHLEDKIKVAQEYMKSQNCKPQGDWSVHYYYAERDEKIYKELLERVKSGKYE